MECEDSARKRQPELGDPQLNFRQLQNSGRRALCRKLESP